MVDFVGAVHQSPSISIRLHDWLDVCMAEVAFSMGRKVKVLRIPIFDKKSGCFPLVGGSDEAFRSESRGKNVVRDGNMDEND